MVWTWDSFSSVPRFPAILCGSRGSQSEPCDCMERIERSLCMRDISHTHTHTYAHAHSHRRRHTRLLFSGGQETQLGPEARPLYIAVSRLSWRQRSHRGRAAFVNALETDKSFAGHSRERVLSAALYFTIRQRPLSMLMDWCSGLVMALSRGRTDPTTAFLLLKSVFFSCGFSLILLSFFLCFSFLLGFPRPDKPDHQDARACVRVSQWLLLWSRCRTWWVWNLRSSCGSQPRSSWEALSKNTTN